MGTPMELPGVNHKFTIIGAGDNGGELDFYLTIGINEGQVVHLDLRITDDRYKSIVILMKACTRLLQRGESLQRVCDLLKYHRYKPRGITTCLLVPRCTSVPDYIGRYLEQRFLTADDAVVEA